MFRKNSSAPLTAKPEADYLKVNLFWLAVIVAVFMPVLNSLILQTVLLSVDGNIAYTELSSALETVLKILSPLTTYANYGILACAAAYYGTKAPAVIALCFSAQPLSLLCQVVSYLAASGNQLRSLVNLALDCAINLLFQAVIFGILLLVGRKKLHTEQNKEIFATLNGKLIGKRDIFLYLIIPPAVFGGIQFLLVLLTVIIDFLDPSLGLPQNAGEVIYIVTELITPLIFLVLGYTVILSIAYFSLYVKKTFKNSSAR